MGIRMSDTDTDIDAARRQERPHIQVSGLQAQRPPTRPRQAPKVAPRRPARAPVRPRPRPAGPARTAPTAPPRVTTARRMPFVVLLCGLLGGTLLSLLVISTTLAAGTFRITNLQSQVSQLSRQRQQLQDQVATATSAQVIGERAYGLGMRPPGVLRFIDLKTGRVRTDAGTGAVARISVPGYTP